jgi:hypothetical protein
MMNIYEMTMLMIWDMNACLTPRGVTVYQFIKLYAEVYTFTVSHNFQMYGFARPKTSETI